MYLVKVSLEDTLNSAIVRSFVTAKGNGQFSPVPFAFSFPTAWRICLLRLLDNTLA